MQGRSLLLPAYEHYTLAPDPKLNPNPILEAHVPEGSEVLLWGILAQIIIRIPNIETLHSTIEVLWTLLGLGRRQASGCLRLDSSACVSTCT